MCAARALLLPTLAGFGCCLVPWLMSVACSVLAVADTLIAADRELVVQKGLSGMLQFGLALNELSFMSCKRATVSWYGCLPSARSAQCSSEDVPEAFSISFSVPQVAALLAKGNAYSRQVL